MGKLNPPYIPKASTFCAFVCKVVNVKVNSTVALATRVEARSL
jgi:hypothetical protein